MRNLLFLLALCCISLHAAAQTDSTVTSGKDSGTVFHYVERMPAYLGNVNEFLSANLNYPDRARENNIQGRVVVKFIVTAEGTLDSVRVTKGIGGGCDQEAIRVVKLMNKWQPGTQNGKAVNVYFTIPIIFHLEDSRKEKRRKRREQ